MLQLQLRSILPLLVLELGLTGWAPIVHGAPAATAEVQQSVASESHGSAALGAPGRTAPPTLPEGARQHLTLLHTNDIHASFSPSPASWRSDRAPLGGFEMLDATVRQIRRDQPFTLLLDAGDLMTGNPISVLQDDGISGWGLFKMMNIAGYDAWAVGNHDFDQGQLVLHELLSRLAFPTLSANLEVSSDAPIYGDVEPYVVKQVGRLQVGIIGLMTPSLSRLCPADDIEGVSAKPPLEVAQALIDELDPVTDVLIAVSHMGDEQDRELAASVSGLDVIIGGHSHQKLYPPIKIGDTIVVQAGSHMRYLGRLDLEVARDRVVRYSGTLIPLWLSAAHYISPEMRGAVAHARSLVEKRYGEELGELITPWRRAYRSESNVGDWLADRMRERAKADVAFLNSGGIRADVPAGPITLRDLMSVLPFDNQLCTFRLSGRELEQVLLANATAALSRQHGILQVSGVRYTYTSSDTGARLLTVFVGGRPLEAEKQYTAATNDYMLFDQPEKYFPGVVPVDPRNTGVQLLDVMTEAATEANRIDAQIDGRITETTSTQEAR